MSDDMKSLKLKPIPRQIKRLHRKHNLHHKTIFYMKEYGPGKDVHSVIVKESVKILLLTSIISTIGGLSLQSIEQRLFAIVPLLILLPAMNGMVGNYGTIVSSRFTTALYLGEISKKWWRSENMRDLFGDIIKVGVISAVYISVLASLAAYMKGFHLTDVLVMKTVLLALICTLVLVTIVFLVSVTAGFYIYSRKEDPNNFLIPITTAVADLGNMAIFTLLIRILF